MLDIGGRKDWSTAAVNQKGMSKGKAKARGPREGRGKGGKAGMGRREERERGAPVTTASNQDTSRPLATSLGQPMLSTTTPAKGCQRVSLRKVPRRRQRPSEASGSWGGFLPSGAGAGCSAPSVASTTSSPAPLRRIAHRRVAGLRRARGRGARGESGSRSGGSGGGSEV